MSSRWWLIPITLAIQEAEIRRITVWSQPKQIVFETLWVLATHTFNPIYLGD
jgi:hypothetical protein